MSLQSKIGGGCCTLFCFVFKKKFDDLTLIVVEIRILYHHPLFWLWPFGVYGLIYPKGSYQHGT